MCSVCVQGGWKEVGITWKKAQFLLTRQYIAESAVVYIVQGARLASCQVKTCCKSSSTGDTLVQAPKILVHCLYFCQVGSGTTFDLAQLTLP